MHHEVFLSGKGAEKENLVELCCFVFTSLAHELGEESSFGKAAGREV